MESPRRQVRCGAGVQSTDLSQRETVFEIPLFGNTDFS